MVNNCFCYSTGRHGEWCPAWDQSNPYFYCDGYSDSKYISSNERLTISSENSVWKWMPCTIYLIYFSFR